MGVKRWLLCIPAFLPFAASAAPFYVDASAWAIQVAYAATGTSEGEVRDIDRGAKTITIKHQAIKGLDMPAMTMVFTAADPKLLNGLKQGDKVRFTAEKKDGTYIVTAIQPAN